MRRNAHGAVLNFNCPVRMTTVPRDTIRRFADLLNVDDEHVRMWMFARLPYPDRSRLLAGEEQVKHQATSSTFRGSSIHGPTPSSSCTWSPDARGH